MRSPSNPAFESSLQKEVLLHSVGWLVAANLVGVWMALLLANPELGSLAGPFTYGRWAPLHLNWQLYGWCSLPLVGMLLRHFLPQTRLALREARVALWAWSGALIIGGLSWLAGESSGKLFLDWSGMAKWILAAAQSVLWGVLFLNWKRRDTTWENRLQRHGNVLLLAGLGSVPFLLCWSASRSVYPPIDPGTGGPTGASLLGSTLGIVVVLSMAPRFLGRRNRSSAAAIANGVYYGFSCLVYALVEHHNSSHQDWSQVLALGTLLAWVPLSAWLLACYDWIPGSRIWLKANLAWWGLLVVTGFAGFCPGVLERIKFTHALVAHAHLAMAGMLSSLNCLILSNLAPAEKTESPLTRKLPFALWQGGLLLHLAVVFAMAFFEVADPAWTLRRESPAPLLFWARLIAGTIMATASLCWFWFVWCGRKNSTAEGAESEQAREARMTFAGAALK